MAKGNREADSWPLGGEDSEECGVSIACGELGLSKGEVEKQGEERSVGIYSVLGFEFLTNLDSMIQDVEYSLVVKNMDSGPREAWVKY